jgi:hypothetical protein
MGFRILFSLFLVGWASGAWASTQVGVLGGLAVTGAQVDTGIAPNTLSGSSVTSYKAGVEGDYDVMPGLLSIEADLLYASYQWSQNTTGSTASVAYSTQWWEIPLFVNYTGIPLFKFGFGPLFDFASGSTPSGVGTTGVDLGFQAGYSYTFRSPWTINADMLYVMGITNLSETSPSIVKLHSFDFLVGLGYAF